MDLKNIDTLGITLKELRTNKGLNQEDLANMLNVKRQTYSAWERGISSPDIETISFLADFYNDEIENIVNLIVKGVGSLELGKKLEQLEDYREMIQDRINIVNVEANIPEMAFKY